MKNEAEASVRLTRWELACLLDGMDCYRRQVKFADGSENKNIKNVGEYVTNEYNRLRGKLCRALSNRSF
jgi:hypothetical protein